MKVFRSKRLNRLGKALTDRRGMTMAELLTVVAILGILAAVAFISIVTYQRKMAQLERDAIAKELFVAAQNHTVMAKGEGYLQNEQYGTADTSDPGVYYYTVNKGTVAPAGATGMFNQMLPFGSIDETVRVGGSYIIRYQPDSGKILDVFYCSAEGTRFGYDMDNATYSNLMSTQEGGYYGPERKDERLNEFNNGDSILGWYGGADAAQLQEITLTAPKISVTNAETLYVDIEDRNGATDKDNKTLTNNYQLRLMITGVSSKVHHYLDIDLTDPIVTGGKTYRCLLDDVTRQDDHFAIKHFGEIKYDDMTVTTTDVQNQMIPGEDIIIQAIAYSNTHLSNIAKSREKVTNSLFEGVADNDNDGNNKPDTAYISNFRHLENLDKYVSNLDANDTEYSAQTPGTTDVLQIKSAVQTADLDWNVFITKVDDFNKVDDTDDSKISYASGTGVPYNPVNETVAGTYRPVRINDTGFVYDGRKHIISNVLVAVTKTTEPDQETGTNKVIADGHAGLFGSVASGSTIRNLELKDFNIESNGAEAGAAVGVLSGTISNVIARNTSNTVDNKISGNVAGGLVGDLSGGSIKFSAAAVVVNGVSVGSESNGIAGGLAGTVAAGASIQGSYAGGHTKNGSYVERLYTDGELDANKKNTTPYDVTGSTAGGLIGSMTGGTVEKSYTTCSVSGSTNAGGFAGSKSGGTINDSYCTGLVNMSTAENNKYAFIGSGAVGNNEEGNQYFSIINEVVNTDGTVTYMEPDAATNSDDITAFDKDTTTYNTFASGTCPAEVYDKLNTDDRNLSKIYKDTYVLRPISKMYTSLDDTYFVRTHYGDWPAPEVFVINN